jgi:hypothetical protein
VQLLLRRAHTHRGRRGGCQAPDAQASRRRGHQRARAVGCAACASTRSRLPLTAAWYALGSGAAYSSGTLPVTASAVPRERGDHNNSGASGRLPRRCVCVCACVCVCVCVCVLHALLLARHDVCLLQALLLAASQPAAPHRTARPDNAHRSAQSRQTWTRGSGGCGPARSRRSARARPAPPAGCGTR